MTNYLNIKTVTTGFLIFSFALGFALGANADTYSPNSNSSCAGITHGLYIGARDSFTGGDVTRLQAFLSAQGFFSAGATGYFGPLTFNAVRNFQRTHNISAIGSVGPLTRAEILRVSCGGNPPPVSTLYINSLSPSSGNVGSSVTIYGSGFTNNNLVLFGNGAVGRVSSTNGTSITFSVPEIQNPACYFSTPPCMTFAAGQKVTLGTYSISITNTNGTSNAVSFTVTDNSTSAPHINSISPSSGAVNTSVTISGTGFNSANAISFGGLNIGSFASNNSGITFTVPQYLTPYCPPYSMCPMYLRMVTPGNYDVIVSNSNGTSNIVNFTVTSGSNNSVSISGIDAPSSLRVGQSGTWTVHATDGNGGSNLSYSVVWGDEANYYPYAANASSGSVSQSTTFTHAYNSTGIFSPRFTVTNNSGSTATVSSSVNVTNY